MTTAERGGASDQAYAAERAEMVRTADPRAWHRKRARARARSVACRATSSSPRSCAPHAYEDHPLPIGHEQTISQPYIVALMTDLLHLDGDEKVLEIGTGSGYQAAVLGELADQVYTIEIVAPLAEPARARLAAPRLRQRARPRRRRLSRLAGAGSVRRRHPDRGAARRAAAA